MTPVVAVFFAALLDAEDESRFSVAAMFTSVFTPSRVELTFEASTLTPLLKIGALDLSIHQGIQRNEPLYEVSLAPNHQPKMRRPEQSPGRRGSNG